MRIAYLCADYGIPVLGGKGGSVHVRELIAALCEQGHNVTLYCTRLGDGDPSRIPARIVEVAKPAGKQTVAMRTSCERDGALISERLAKEQGWMARAQALEIHVAADHAICPFDMIYERYSLWSRAGTRLSAKLGIPCIMEVNSPLLAEAQEYRELAAVAEARAIEREVMTSATAIVAVSDGVGRYAIDCGAAPERVNVIANGVDLKAFNPRTEPACIAGLGTGPVIGFVGGLKPWHGIQELLAAFRNVSRRHPDARLLIVGDGPMRGWIDGFAAGTGLADRIHVTGWVAHDELPGLVNAIDIATAPYPQLPSFYFSPLKLFEYMAAGRAIVASRIGQIENLVTHCQTGLLVEPGNVMELEVAIGRLLDDKALRQRLGARANAVAREFTWANNARRVLALADPRPERSAFRGETVAGIGP